MKKINSIAIKNNGRFRMQNRFFLAKEIRLLPDGKYSIEISKYYHKASTKQFGYLYGCVYPHSIIALLESGEEDITTIEEADLYWKLKFMNKKIVDRSTGEIILLPISKADFKTIDEMAYCDKIRNTCSEYLGYYIPDPDPNYKSKTKQ